MPRNAMTSPWITPRTRPAAVRTTVVLADAPPAARTNGAALAVARSPACSRRRRRRSMASRLRPGISLFISEGPVLDELWPHGGVDADGAAHAEAMTAAIEHV